VFKYVSTGPLIWYLTFCNSFFNIFIFHISYYPGLASSKAIFLAIHLSYQVLAYHLYHKEH